MQKTRASKHASKRAYMHNRIETPAFMRACAVI